MSGWAAGYTGLPLAPGSVKGAAFGISADGTVVVGYVNEPGSPTVFRACYWTAGGAPVLIGGAGTVAHAVSADGAIIAGDGNSVVPWRWTAGGGLVTFGVVGDAAAAISADGSRVVGSHPTGVGARTQACYWNAAGTRTDLGYLPGHDDSQALGISGDGTVIVGRSAIFGSAGTPRAWRWTAGSGMVNLGVGPSTESRAFDVSNDGAVIVGGLQGIPGGFRWTAAGGMVGVALFPATGLSGDGTTIIGTAESGTWGNTAGYIRDGVLTIPDPIEIDPDAPGWFPQMYASDGAISDDGATFAGYSFGDPTFPWVFGLAVAPPDPTTSLVLDDVLVQHETPVSSASSKIFLEWSDDSGHTYGSPVGQPIGQVGAYLTSINWNRCGYGRDRVFRLTWSVPVATALQGAFVDVEGGKG